MYYRDSLKDGDIRDDLNANGPTPGRPYKATEIFDSAIMKFNSKFTLLPPSMMNKSDKDKTNGGDKSNTSKSNNSVSLNRSTPKVSPIDDTPMTGNTEKKIESNKIMEELAMRDDKDKDKESSNHATSAGSKKMKEYAKKVKMLKEQIAIKSLSQSDTDFDDRGDDGGKILPSRCLRDLIKNATDDIHRAVSRLRSLENLEKDLKILEKIDCGFDPNGGGAGGGMIGGGDKGHRKLSFQLDTYKPVILDQISPASDSSMVGGGDIINKSFPRKLPQITDKSNSQISANPGEDSHFRICENLGEEKYEESDGYPEILIDSAKSGDSTTTRL